jgi:hypothetical protein
LQSGERGIANPKEGLVLVTAYENLKQIEWSLCETANLDNDKTITPAMYYQP